jgi:uncharacterized protein
MASNVEATKKGYECFQRGDIPSLIRDLLDDSCIWISPGPSDKLPWAGTFKGKQEIANFFAQVGENLEFSEFAPREMIEQGETVVVLVMRQQVAVAIHEFMSTRRSNYVLRSSRLFQLD